MNEVVNKWIKDILSHIFNSDYVNELVWERRNSSALAMELCPSCINPSISSFMFCVCPDHYHDSMIFLVGYDAIPLS